jgi:hypothetical protein
MAFSFFSKFQVTVRSAFIVELLFSAMKRLKCSFFGLQQISNGFQCLCAHLVVISEDNALKLSHCTVILGKLVYKVHQLVIGHIVISKIELRNCKSWALNQSVTESH